MSLSDCPNCWETPCACGIGDDGDDWIKRTALILAFALLAGCRGQASTTEQISTDFRVDTLFVKDGCTVYRFVDGAYPIYFTNCKGDATWQEPCGRNCYRPQVVTGAKP